ncbi:hypothetical protein KFE25_011934 [Diacronema lutheri]|uniref:Uncharacterized protein n=2 Tax=Diacronema lutheri TaxID=2081491 RepID=A0A8J5X6P3_DIALT|nr:hypothetical protein KFE25_011934 [Diacronema lutheri]
MRAGQSRIARLGAAPARALLVLACCAACTSAHAHRPTPLRRYRPFAIAPTPCRRRACGLVARAGEPPAGEPGRAVPRARSAPRRFASALGRASTELLPVWILVAALLALKWPWLFAWFGGGYYTAGLGAMMLSTALTLRAADFADVWRDGKRAIAAGAAMHVLLKPPLALGLARALGLSPPALAGLVLLAAAPGAQSTSVAVLLARGNVALSVCIVTLLNLSAFATTPLFTKALGGGATVCVSAAAMSRTTVQVVLAPIVVGLLVNALFPAVRKRAATVGPRVGSVLATLFAGSGTSLIAPAFATVTPALLVAVGAFHAGGSLLGWLFGRLARLKPDDTRVLAILGGMQSSSLAFLLATRHLPDMMGSVPAAISVSTMLLWGMTLAAAMTQNDRRAAGGERHQPAAPVV